MSVIFGYTVYNYKNDVVKINSYKSIRDILKIKSQSKCGVGR